MLLSYEKHLLCAFILQTKEERERTLREARANPRVSGPLINAYQWVVDNV